MGASMIARVRYDLHDGRLTPSSDQPWRVSAEPWESPFGPFEADQPFRKGGCDIFLFGSARQVEFTKHAGVAARRSAEGRPSTDTPWRRSQRAFTRVGLRVRRPRRVVPLGDGVLAAASHGREPCRLLQEEYLHHPSAGESNRLATA
jgi:hypothetical protein